MEKWIPLIILGVIIFIGLIIFIKVKTSLSRFSKSVFGTSNIIDGIKANEERISATPKSVSGGDSMFIDKIHKDFPEFNLSSAKLEITQFLKRLYAGEDCGEDFKLFQKEILNKYNNPSRLKVHKCVISGYDKSYVDAVIKFQISYEIYASQRTQLRSEISYVFSTDSNKALKCPHCGGPVSGLGIKQCEFCGHGIVYDIEEVWKLKNMKNI